MRIGRFIIHKLSLKRFSTTTENLKDQLHAQDAGEVSAAIIGDLK